MRIYLAGRITKNCWRHKLVAGLKAALSTAPRSHWRTQDDSPLPPGCLPGAIFGEHDYMGPFFSSCDHGCAHAGMPHAVATGACGDLRPWDRDVYDMCTDGVCNSDLVFAFVRDRECFGTLFEIGFARAHNVPTAIAFTDEGLAKDMWLASVGAKTFLADDDDESREGALRAAIEWAKRRAYLPGATPIEQEFWRAGGRRLGLSFQYTIGKYRVDFVHEETKLAIELDGLVGHSTPADIEKDRRRQREIEALGFRFIRFGGREVFNDPASCVLETEHKILSLGGKVATQ